MRKHKMRWEIWEKQQMRFIVIYRHGEPGKKYRRVAYRKALYATGRLFNKPFRKE